MITANILKTLESATGLQLGVKHRGIGTCLGLFWGLSALIDYGVGVDVEIFFWIEDGG